MSAADDLRRYAHMQICDVIEHPAGLVLDLRPVGYMTRRRVFISGAITVTDVTDTGWTQADDDQAQVDIGDAMYERGRYDAHDIDVTGDEDDPATRRRSRP